jgi:hypothetical protein
VSELAAQPDEVSELAFFTPEMVPPLAFPIDTDIFRDWQSTHW